MRIIELISTFFIGVIFGVIYICTIKAHTTPTEIPEPVIEYVYIEAEPQVITEVKYVPYEEPFYRNLTEEDKIALLDIAMREAENQDVIDQAMVMYTVICRAEAFNQTIKEVCDSSAFSSSAFRSGITPNENCNEALARIEEGWIPKPLYFRRDCYHNFGTPLYQVGPHYFSGK